MTQLPHRKTKSLRIGTLLLAGTALAALAQPAAAQAVWDGSESDDWGVDGNWSTGILPPANSTVSINNGTVTRQPVIATGDEFNVRSVNVGAADGTAPVLTVNGVLGLGDGPNGGSLNIASAANNLTGTVLVSGADARIGPAAGATAGIAVRVGTTLGSNGTLRIENGGTGRFQTIQIANGVPSAAGTGLVEVIGAGSLLEITSGSAGLSIGNRNEGGGVGTLRILDGAAFTTPGGVGTFLGLGSSILVSGADAEGNGSRFVVPTQLLMIGSSFTVEDGAEAQITGFILEGNSTFNLLDGGTLSSLGGAIGSSPFADSNVTATVSGAGSRWTSTPTNGTLAIGNGTTGIGRLEVLNGGEVDFNSALTLGAGSSLRVAGTDAAGGNARLTVGSAQSLNGDILVDDGGIATFTTIGLNNPASLTVTAGGLVVVEETSTFSIAQQAEVRISGAGAEISSNGGLGLINNTADLPATDFIIENGARLELGGTVGAGVSFSTGGSVRRNLIVRGGSELEIINSGFGFSGSNGAVIVESGSQVITQGSWSLGGASELSITGGSRMELNGAANSTFSPATDVLISGEGSLLDIAANLSFGGGNPGGGTVVISDGATLRTRGPSDNGLGFNGVLRTMEITNGSSWTMTGGINSGLQIETTNLVVQDSELSAEGIVSIGLRFTGTNLVLRNSDLTARALSVGSVAGNTVFIGTRADGSAGGAGLFNVGSISLTGGNTLEINHTESDFTIASTITGAGAINHRAGSTRFTGAQAGYSGLLSVTGGNVAIDGALGGNAARATFDDARLSGSGSFGGDVTLSAATLAPGNSAGTFTIGGNLVLGVDSVLEFELGAPDQAPGAGSDLIVVGGDLTLDGTLNIANLGGFGSGLYRLINFGGSLTDNGIEFGSVPVGFEATGLMLDLATAGQVNLLAVAAEPDFDFIFWDGANSSPDGLINGGSGTWSVDGTNWTTPEADNNGAYDPADFLIFRAPEQVVSAGVQSAAAATPSSSIGTVSVDNAAGQVSLSNGVQFATSGYTVSGGAIRLDAPGVVFRVGDGTAQGGEFVATVSSPLIGEGGLTKTDLGTLILLGTNSYTGGTSVAGGTLQGNVASLQGPIDIAAAGTLLFDQSSDGTFAGALSGTGAFAKEGTGVLTLSGNSADYLGRADLLAGGFNITGTLGGDSGDSLLATAAGTTLTGNGSVGNLTVGGSIAPGAGNAPGAATLNVAGNVTFSAGSLYRVDLAASGAGDRIVAGGDAFINGGTVEINLLNPELDYVDGTVFTIVQAGGALTGQFAGLVENSAFLDFTLGYDANSAFLTLDLVRMFPDVALTFNQRQASLGLMELDRTAGSDSLEVYNALLLLDEDAARDAFDLASGEIYADILAAGNRLAMSRASARQLGSAAIGREGWNAWIAGTLADTRVSGDGNGARFEQDARQIELGLDYHGADNAWMVGVSGGWLSSDLVNDERSSSAELDGWFASFAARYGDYGSGLTLAAAASYAEQSGETLRNIAFGTINRNAAAQVDTDSTALLADIRYGFGSDVFAFGPVAGIEHASTSLEGYSETGAGALSLSGNGADESWTRYGGGIFASYRGSGITALVDARYLTADTGAESVQHGLAGSPRTFTVLPARGDSDTVRVSGTLEGELGKNVQFSLGAHAYLAGDETTIAGSAGLRIAF